MKELPSNQDIYSFFREFPWLNVTAYLNFTGFSQTIFSQVGPMDEKTIKRTVAYFKGPMRPPAMNEGRIKKWLKKQHNANRIKLTSVATHLDFDGTTLFRWVTGSRGSMPEGHIEKLIAEIERFKVEGGKTIVRRPTQN